jgi:hypothetical protein
MVGESDAELCRDVEEVILAPAVAERDGKGDDVRIARAGERLGGVDQVEDRVLNVEFLEQQPEEARRPGKSSRGFRDQAEGDRSEDRSPLCVEVLGCPVNDGRVGPHAFARLSFRKSVAGGDAEENVRTLSLWTRR